MANLLQLGQNLFNQGKQVVQKYNPILQAISNPIGAIGNQFLQIKSPVTRQTLGQTIKSDPMALSFTRPLANIQPATQRVFSPILGQNNAANLGYALRGATQLTPFQVVNSLGLDRTGQQMYRASAPVTPQQKQAQALGRTAYGYALTAPIGGANLLRNTATRALTSTLGGAGIGGAISKATGGSFMEGAKSGADMGFKFGPLGAVTNPLTSKLISGVGGGLVANQLGGRTIGGLANLVENEIMGKVDGLNINNKDRALSFIMGAALSQNSKLINASKVKLKQMGVNNPEQAIALAKSRLPEKPMLIKFTMDGQDNSFVVGKQEASDWTAYLQSQKIKYQLNPLGAQGGFAQIGKTPKPPTNSLESLKAEAGQYNGSTKVEGKLYDIFNKKYLDIQDELGIDKELIKNLPKGLTIKEASKHFDVSVAGVGQNAVREIVEELRTTDLYNQSQLTPKPPSSPKHLVNQQLESQALASSPLKPGKQVQAPEQKVSGSLSSSSTQQIKSQTQLEQKIKTTAKPESQLALNKIIAEGNSQIGTKVDQPGKTVKQTLSDLYTQWVDRYNPLVKASQQAKKTLKIKGAELRPEYDPEYLVRRLTGAGGIADYRFNTELKPVIDQIDQAGISKLDMDTYLASKRMAGFGKAGREVYGTDPQKAGQIVLALELKYGDGIKQLSDQLYAYQSQGFQEMVDAGFLSKESADLVKQQNPDYSPLNRVMDQMDEYLGLPTRKTMQGTNPVMKIKGSTKKIDSPLESIIGNTFRQRAAIEKNRVARSLVGLQKIVDLGFSKALKSGEDTITVWNNGNKEYWRVGKDIADTAKGVNEEVTNTLLKIIQAPASLLRQGATGRNPDFMLPNIVRDQLDAGITSKYGYIPFVDYVSGLKSMLTNDDVYKKWQSSGAKIDLGELSGRKSIQQLFDDKSTRRGLFKWLGSTLDVMGKYSEQPTRVGLFKKAYKETGNELLAAMESRDATVDFARMGSKMKVANSIIPFLNVGVQGFDKLIRSVKDHPGKVALNMGIYAAIPAITTTLYNLANYKNEYTEIPQYEKDANFIIVKGRNADGTVDYLTIPKGNVLPVVANPLQSFIEYLSDADQQSFGELATSLISQTLPVIGDGQSLKEVALKTIGSNLPQAIKPITENLINKSFYKYDTKKEDTKEIVPYYLKKKPAYQQAYDWTPSTYKAIGAVLNVSPLQVQNLMEGYLAGYTKIPTQIVDILKNMADGNTIDPNQKPLLRRFIKQTYTSSTTKPETEIKTPSLMDRITGKVGAVESTPIPPDQESFDDLYKKALNKGTGFVQDKKAIEYDPTLTDIEKADKIAKLRLERVSWAETLIKMEDQYPDKVFNAQLITYGSGKGMTVQERGDWVYKTLNKTQDKNELQDTINKLWENKVLTTGTKGVAQYLDDTYGLKLNYTGKDTKTKKATTKKAKKGAKITVKAPKISKIKLKTFKPIKIKTAKRPKFKAYKPKKLTVKFAKPKVQKIVIKKA